MKTYLEDICYCHRWLFLLFFLNLLHAVAKVPHVLNKSEHMKIQKYFGWN